MMITRNPCREESSKGSVSAFPFNTSMELMNTFEMFPATRTPSLFCDLALAKGHESCRQRFTALHEVFKHCFRHFFLNIKGFKKIEMTGISKEEHFIFLATEFHRLVPFRIITTAATLVTVRRNHFLWKSKHA